MSLFLSFVFVTLSYENFYSRLKVAAAADSESSEEELEPETEDQRAKRLEFEKRRKMHYNEFQAVKMARKLLEEELAELEEEDTTDKSQTKKSTTNSSQQMDVDKEDKSTSNN